VHERQPAPVPPVEEQPGNGKRVERGDHGSVMSYCVMREAARLRTLKEHSSVDAFGRSFSPVDI
jgi:hypothetical protein